MAACWRPLGPAAPGLRRARLRASAPEWIGCPAAACRAAASAAAGCSASCRSHRELLGVPCGAPPRDVRAAFVTAAWRAHPDAGGRESGDAAFVRLRASYEALLRCTAACRPAEGGTPMAAEAGGGPAAAAGGRAAPPAASHSSRFSRAVERPRPTWGAARSAGGCQRVEARPMPELVSVTTPGESVAPQFCGIYRRTRDFNGSPAYVRDGLEYYLYWSRLFRDWKIGELLAEQGLCAAFCEGDRETPPWQAAAAPSSNGWSVWLPATREYQVQRLAIVALTDGRPP